MGLICRGRFPHGAGPHTRVPDAAAFTAGTPSWLSLSHYAAAGLEAPPLVGRQRRSGRLPLFALAAFHTLLGKAAAWTAYRGACGPQQLSAASRLAHAVPVRRSLSASVWLSHSIRKMKSNSSLTVI